MTLILCRACRRFFDKRKRACPDCGAARTANNEALVSQAWRTNLNRHAAHADKHT